MNNFFRNNDLAQNVYSETITEQSTNNNLSVDEIQNLNALPTNVRATREESFRNENN